MDPGYGAALPGPPTRASAGAARPHTGRGPSDTMAR
jgi:hypothetical protein